MTHEDATTQNATKITRPLTKHEDFNEISFKNTTHEDATTQNATKITRPQNWTVLNRKSF